LQQSPLTFAGFDSEEQSERARWVGFDARSSLRRIAISDGWLAVGDASFAFDPLCGRGVTEALSSGCDAANWATASQPCRRRTGMD